MPSVRETRSDGGTGGQLMPIVQSMAAQHGGNRYAIGDGAILLGREPDCGIVYQEGTPGVSRKHCAVTWDDEKNCFVLMDLSSSYGTFLENGMRLEPRKPYYLRPGNCFYLADRANMIRLDVDSAPAAGYTSTDFGDSARTDFGGGTSLNLGGGGGADFGGDGGIDFSQDTGRSGGQKNSKQIKLAIAIAAAVLLLLIPTFCLTEHFLGNGRMDKGDYVGAVKAYKTDFLFSKKARTEAALQAGEAFYEEKDYVTAAEYFLLAGEAGAERHFDALCARAEQLTEEGDPEAAIELLQDYAEDARAQELTALAQLAIAERQLNSGDIDGAIETAKDVQKIGSADPVSFLNRAYDAKAVACMEARDYLGAAKAFESMKGNTKAKKDAEILRAIAGKDWFTAAKAADEAVKNAQSQYSRGKWSDIFWDAFGSVSSTDVDRRLARGAVMAILREEKTRSEEEWKQAIRSALSISSSMVGDLSSRKDDRSELDFTSACGAAPNGKILFVMSAKDYPDKNQTQAVLYDVMDLLPAEYYPRSLDEVEYLVTLSFDTSYYAEYQKVTIGVRETARAEVFQLPSERKVYDALIYGDDPPYSFEYYGAPPAYKSGGAPDPTDIVYKALMAVIK